MMADITGANDTSCTWVEADLIEMKPLAGGRAKVDLQVSRDNAPWHDHLPVASSIMVAFSKPMGWPQVVLWHEGHQLH